MHDGSGRSVAKRLNIMFSQNIWGWGGVQPKDTSEKRAVAGDKDSPSAPRIPGN